MRRAAAPLLFLCLILFSTSAFAQNEKVARYMPKSTHTIMSLNIDKMRGTPAFEDLLRAVEAIPEFKKLNDLFQNEIGLDMRQDISWVAMGGKRDFDDMVMVIDGRIDAKRFHAAMRKDKNVKHVPGPPDRYETGSATVILDGSTIILYEGQRDFVEDVWMAIRDPKTSKSKDKTFKQRAKKIGTKDTFWMVSTDPKILQPFGGKGSFLARLGVTKALSGKAIIQTTKKEDAVRIENEMREGIKNAAADPMMVNMFGDEAKTAVKISRSKNDVIADLKLSKDGFNKLRAMLAMAAGGGAPPANTTKPAPTKTKPKAKSKTPPTKTQK